MSPPVRGPGSIHNFDLECQYCQPELDTAYGRTEPTILVFWHNIHANSLLSRAIGENWSTFRWSKTELFFSKRSLGALLKKTTHAMLSADYIGRPKLNSSFHLVYWHFFTSNYRCSNDLVFPLFQTVKNTAFVIDCLVQLMKVSFAVHLIRLRSTHVGSAYLEKQKIWRPWSRDSAIRTRRALNIA